ncbi:ribonuclease G [Kineothrix alysoides]|uniref:Ribonuclease G n=1 Tax=Kineothrix alysoides TaxID=1469948 RepID=A0A4R1QZU0_9FIRM|nr:ribonuclease E/G [Kineothrix alysoides]TCL58518.1 ribonuclease G [Kineothrix alysoides]
MNDRKYVILKRNHQILSLLFHGNRLRFATAEEEEGSVIGNIYVAKVKNISANINAAFVEIAPGFPCFLALSEAKNPILTNRSYDGRILAGDDIVVQINKDAVKTKQPAATCALSLSGKYCVVSLGRPGIAYSSKLSMKVRTRISEALKEEFALLPKGIGTVIRTNAKDLKDYSPLLEEWKELTAQLKELAEVSVHRTGYSLLYKKPSDYLIRLRDTYAGQYEEIVTDDEGIYEEIAEYSRLHPAFCICEARLYKDALLPLHKLYSVDARLKEALDKKVWLKSGGYLIIEPTEALTVIDVNTGKVSTKKDDEETFFRMNMEAAEEIALQLTLRNISGIIVIDFINMRKQEHSDKLMAHFGDLLKRDPVKTNLVDMTVLGLVEVTRMKINRPLKEQISQL